MDLARPTSHLCMETLTGSTRCTAFTIHLSFSTNYWDGELIGSTWITCAVDISMRERNFLQVLQRPEHEEFRAIAHRKTLGLRTVTHIVVVESAPVRNADGKITALSVIEAQGYDDRLPTRPPPAFTSSAEKTVRHDYVAEYMNITGYLDRLWVFRVP